VSDADALNGISYRGRATFGFRVYRCWTASSGWGEWKDSVRYYNEFVEALSRIAAAGPPEGFGSDFQLSYTFEKKDGHWRTTAANGDLFVNGKYVGRSSDEVTSGGAREGYRIWQPKLEVVESIASGQGSQRLLDRTTGDQCRASPEEIDRNSITTMTMLRRRPL
jgi:hypothetical protein